MLSLSLFSSPCYGHISPHLRVAGVTGGNRGIELREQWRLRRADSARREGGLPKSQSVEELQKSGPLWRDLPSFGRCWSVAHHAAGWVCQSQVQEARHLGVYTEFSSFLVQQLQMHCYRDLGIVHVWDDPRYICPIVLFGWLSQFVQNEMIQTLRICHQDVPSHSRKKTATLASVNSPNYLWLVVIKNF